MPGSRRAHRMLCHTHLCRRHDDALLVAPLWVSLIAVPSLLAHVQRTYARSGGSLVVDMTSTARVEPCVLRWLLWADAHARRCSGRLAVVPPAPGVLDPVALLVVTCLWGERTR